MANALLNANINIVKRLKKTVGFYILKPYFFVFFVFTIIGLTNFSSKEESKL